MIVSKKRILIAGGITAAILMLTPSTADSPGTRVDIQPRQGSEAAIVSAEKTPGPAKATGADLSARTEQGCMVHRTMIYAPCGHSAQRREKLDAGLVGLTHAALSAQIGDVYPGAAVTAFDAREVDITLRLDIPCPLHWMLAVGEDGCLCVMQNRTGEEMTLVRATDVPADLLGEQDRARAAQGMIFDSVQALEGYLESLTS